MFCFGWNSRRTATLLAAMLVSSPVSLSGAEPEAVSPPDQILAETCQDDVALLAAAIDDHIEAKWRANNVTPAPLVDDAEFLRRVSLDLAGRIPSVWEVRDFLADDDPHKRRRIVDRLLESPMFYSHFAVKWRRMLIPQAGADLRLQFQIPEFDVWLRHKLLNNVAYDELVRDILALPLNEDTRNPAEIFYTAGNARPESLAAATSRHFLGVRLECAQCHDHPFSHWQQEEFWSLAAFFAGMEVEQNGRLIEDAQVRTIRLPDSDRLLEARFLSGEAPDLSGDRNPRQVLADWLTRSENPYFARTAANRVWAELFGIGIVDPPDDFDEANPPSHPELLDQLALEFAAHDFDVTFLMRAIAASRTYQLTSRQTDDSQQNPHLFARHTARALTADQLYDSLVQAIGYDDSRGFRNRNGLNSPRSRVRDLFDNQAERPNESQATILQALAMMNGEMIQFATDTNGNPMLVAIMDAPFFTDAQRIEALYLATLSRPPRLDELQRMTAYVASHSDPQQNGEDAKAAALADIFWALLNSNEFVVNH